MTTNSFINRYFESGAILLKFEHSEKRSMTTFMNYLENLHSVADKLKDKFGCSIKDIPEFVVLRIIGNYFHHVDDIEEYSLQVEFEEWGIYENNRHLIISLKDFGKALKNFIGNTKNQKYLEKQLELMSEFIEYEFITRVDEIVNIAKISIDGKVYKVGIDIFKYVYNISNIIADECRKIDELKNMDVIINLEETYTKEYNIQKRDLLCCPGNIPIITIEGLIFSKNRESVRRV